MKFVKIIILNYYNFHMKLNLYLKYILIKIYTNEKELIETIILYKKIY
jgi:hypothetical protein